MADETNTYVPAPGEKVLVTLEATLNEYDGNYLIADDNGGLVVAFPPGQSYLVRVEPAPVQLPTTPGSIARVRIETRRGVLSDPIPVHLIADHERGDFLWWVNPTTGNRYDSADIAVVVAVLPASPEV